MKSNLRYWQLVLREAERELEAATTRTALDAAAKKLIRAKAELKRSQATSGARPGRQEPDQRGGLPHKEAMNLGIRAAGSSAGHDR